jgi:hypothetical protein
MIFDVPDHCLPRLVGLVADASDSDGSPELIIRFSIKTEDGEQPSEAEIVELRAVLAGYAADGPLDSRVQTQSELPK